MATIQEKLANSLEVLKELQDRHNKLVIRGVGVLGETHTKRLVNAGFLQEVLRGWYIPSRPGSEGDTTVWYASYWAFIVSYANFRFGDYWCLTPEESLSFYAGNTIIPKQLIIRSPKASNNITKLLFDCTLLDIMATLPSKIEREENYGLHLYSLAEALVFCSPSFYHDSPMEAQTCLCQISDASEILSIVVANGNSSRAGRIVGALQQIGRQEIADDILRRMKRLGYDIRVENPFAESSVAILPQDDPYSNRIRLMWKNMRKDVLKFEHLLPQSVVDVNIVLKQIDDRYIKDSYHSLSIEGYRITEGLLERVRDGKWNPQENEKDLEYRNALAARGYYQSYQLVKSTIKQIFEGMPAGVAFERYHQDWHFELFEPCVVANIIAPADLMGYRNQPVYIRGSRHTPLPEKAVRGVMQTLCELMKLEDSAIVRAILGHFIFVYIHPYVDGNGRTARFVMNSMLVTGGYDWVVIPTERRDEYMSALEVASVDNDITKFCEFIFSLLKG
ncbi:MAG: Fic family protein [Paludibacteraceae bacterium]|nr:Fic family protein [Paludibacteraceae bacterium]